MKASATSSAPVLWAFAQKCKSGTAHAFARGSRRPVCGNSRVSPADPIPGNDLPRWLAKNRAGQGAFCSRCVAITNAVLGGGRP